MTKKPIIPPEELPENQPNEFEANLFALGFKSYSSSADRIEYVIGKYSIDYMRFKIHKWFLSVPDNDKPWIRIQQAINIRCFEDIKTFINILSL